jgi:hypothetical protein
VVEVLREHAHDVVETHYGPYTGDVGTAPEFTGQLVEATQEVKLTGNREADDILTHFGYSIISIIDFSSRAYPLESTSRVRTAEAGRQR